MPGQLLPPPQPSQPPSPPVPLVRPDVGARHAHPLARVLAMVGVAVATGVITYQIVRPADHASVAPTSATNADSRTDESTVATPNIDEQVIDEVVLPLVPDTEPPVQPGGAVEVFDPVPTTPAAEPLPTSPPAETIPPETSPATTLAPATSLPATLPPIVGTPCRSELGWGLVIPDGWYTGTGAGICREFAPYPITSYDDGSTDATLIVDVYPGTFDASAVVAMPEDRTIIDASESMIGDRRMREVESFQIGDGWYLEGTLVYEVWLEDGERTIEFSTWSATGDLGEAPAVVIALATSFGP